MRPTYAKKDKTSKEDKTKIIGKAKRDLSAASLKSILLNMPEDEVHEIYYKKLLLFFIVDQFLLPTTNPECSEAVANGKSNLVACTPVLETMLFDRITKLKPDDSGKFVSTMPHVFKYETLRKSSADWHKKLKYLSQADVENCPYCEENIGVAENTGGEAGNVTSDVENIGGEALGNIGDHVETSLNRVENIGGQVNTPIIETSTVVVADQTNEEIDVGTSTPIPSSH
ncbi:hypothetical protein A2U01_0013830, partial [Trifolium medium]|nr:hypothetical protein [Trifolium medium]